VQFDRPTFYLKCLSKEYSSLNLVYPKWFLFTAGQAIIAKPQVPVSLVVGS
jgi:hypothetical protein